MFRTWSWHRLFQYSSPAWEPLRWRPGKSSCWSRKVLTTANAEPVAAKVPNSSDRAPRTPASGVQGHLVAQVVDQPDRQLQFQFPAAGLGQDPAAEPGSQEMESGFLCGHCRYAD